MIISTRIRRMAAITAATAALGFGAFAAAVPARAATTPTPTESADVTPPGGNWYEHCDWSNANFAFASGDVTIGSTTMPYTTAGNLSINQGGYIACAWTDDSTGAVFLRTKLTMQSDGNFVYYNYTDNKVWGAATRAADNPKGPGVFADYQTDGNLVVRNASNTAIWASGTSHNSNDILVFQPDGNLVIYTVTSSGYKAAWATGTE
jgi:hypothetical protein